MIVVTAPTGAIGHQVLDNLLDRGVPLRVIARDPSHLSLQTRERVEVVQGSHGDPDVVTKAFAGADTVFWLVPPDPHADSVEAAYVDFSRPACVAFTSQEVERVVGVSALGRGTAVAARAGNVTASLAMDDLIASTGVSYRALTMPSFMDNLLRQADAIKNQGAFFSPISGDRKLPACATRDIAAATAELLLDSSWSGVGHVPVLGPEDLSFDDMAQIMSEVLERPIRFQQIPGEAYKDQMVQAVMPAPWPRRCSTWRWPRTPASTTPNRAPPTRPPPPASAGGARRCSGRPSSADTPRRRRGPADDRRADRRGVGAARRRVQPATAVSGPALAGRTGPRPRGRHVSLPGRGGPGGLVHPGGRVRQAGHREPPHGLQQARHADPPRAGRSAWAPSGNGFEVDLVPDYRILDAAGYHVLAYDLRNHGLSGAANGGVASSGIFEARDVAGQLRMHALEVLSVSLCRTERYSDAITAALAAVRAEPLRESSQKALISAHLGEGNISEAVRQLSAYRKLLDHELGIAPSPQLAGIVAAALRVEAPVIP